MAGAGAGGGRRPEIRALTGLRGVAAVWVVFYHLIPMAAQAVPALRWMQRLTVTGDLGVDLFFMLSGFVLSYAYTVDKVFGTDSRPTQRLRYYLHFLSVRLARVYPVHLAVLLALGVAAVGAHVAHIDLNQTGTFGWDFGRNLFLVQGWDLSSHLSWDGPAWSVSCEWAAYLAFPVILVFVSRVRRVRAALVGIAVSLGAMLAFYSLVGSAQPQLTFQYPLARIAGEFVAGCFLFRIYQSRMTRRVPGPAQSMVGPVALVLAAVGGALLAAAGTGTVWVVPLFALVIVGTWRDDTSWGRRLSSARMVRAGEASYALYMIHYPALLALQKLWLVPSSPWLRLAVMVVGVTIVVIGARVVYAWIEVPARRLIRARSEVLLPVAARSAPTAPIGAPPGRSSGRDSGTLRRDSILVLVGNVVTGLSNYGFTLVLVWLLPDRQFSQVASVSALLLVAGTAASAGIPWVVAQEVVRRSPDDPARHQAVGFSLAVALVLGSATAGAILLLSSGYADVGVEVAAMIATPAIFVAQVGAGYLQGARRFQFFAVVMTLEAVARLAFGAVLAATGFGPTGAVTGSAIGAVIAALIAVWIVRKELAWPRSLIGGLWRQLGGIGGVQIGVALLSTLDVIIESVLHGTSRPFAGYQAMLVFTRIPLFVSGALSAVVYPRLVKRRETGEAVTVADTTKLFLLTTALIAALASSLPRGLLSLILPNGYANSASLLVPLAVAGAACGQINFSTTLLQARSAFRPALRVLAVGLPVTGVALALASSSVRDLAWVAATADLTIAAILVGVTHRHFEGSRVVRLSLVGAAGTAALIAVFALLHPHPVAWVIAAAVLCALGLATLRSRLLAVTSDDEPADDEPSDGSSARALDPAWPSEGLHASGPFEPSAGAGVAVAASETTGVIAGDLVGDAAVADEGV